MDCSPFPGDPSHASLSSDLSSAPSPVDAGAAAADPWTSPRFRRSLKQFAQSKVPPRDAEDVVQQTFVEIFEFRRRAEHRGARLLVGEALTKWIWRALESNVIDYWRRAASRTKLEASLRDSAAPSSVPPYEDIADTMRWAEGQLPPGEEARKTWEHNQREAEGEKLIALAADAGVTKSALGKRIARQRKFLHRRWRETQSRAPIAIGSVLAVWLAAVSMYLFAPTKAIIDPALDQWPLPERESRTAEGGTQVRIPMVVDGGTQSPRAHAEKRRAHAVPGVDVDAGALDAAVHPTYELEMFRPDELPPDDGLDVELPTYGLDGGAPPTDADAGSTGRSHRIPKDELENPIFDAPSGETTRDADLQVPPYAVDAGTNPPENRNAGRERPSTPSPARANRRARKEGEDGPHDRADDDLRRRGSLSDFKH